VNPIIKEADFRRQIKSAPRPCYFFFGEEDYLKSAAIKQAYSAICADPAFDIFNYAVIDGREYTPDKLLDALAPPPMMADRKLVVLQNPDFMSIKQGEIQALCEVLAALEDYDYNTLIITTASDGFDPGTLPKKPSSLLSTLCEYATAVQFDRSTPAKLAAWAQKHYAAHGATASAEVATYTVEYCGRDMFSLAGEIDKIACYALSHQRTEVSIEDVQRVAIPAVEYDSFAFANAIADGRRADALQILDDFRFRRVDPIIVLGEVVRVYSDMMSVKVLADKGFSAPEISTKLRMHEYRVGLYLKTVRRISMQTLQNTVRATALADAELKSGAKGYAPLEKLICS